MDVFVDLDVAPLTEDTEVGLVVLTRDVAIAALERNDVVNLPFGAGRVTTLGTFCMKVAACLEDSLVPGGVPKVVVDLGVPALRGAMDLPAAGALTAAPMAAGQRGAFGPHFTLGASTRLTKRS